MNELLRCIPIAVEMINFYSRFEKLYDSFGRYKIINQCFHIDKLRTPLKCDDCEKCTHKFTHPLKVHINIHRGEKPYKYDVYELLSKLSFYLTMDK